MAKPPKPTTAPTGPLAAGTILQARYIIERLIGGGGMGMVYLARDKRLSNRPCALKEMVDHFIDQQQRIEANEYFAREADTLAQLKHPAIPAVSDRFDDQNRHYLVMEHVEGRNLEEEIAHVGGPLPEGVVIDVARQLADVLAYLHSFSPPIIYRDMKPSNVMMTPKGRVVLVDFGIARLFRASRKGTMIGTLGFAPPEQYQGLVDPRSDIYSLGATLHYVLTGRDPEKHPPFSFPPVRELRAEVSRNLAGAIDAALAYEVSQRPSTVQEFRDMMLYGTGLGAGGVARVNARSGTNDLSLAASYADVVAAREPSTPARRAIGLAVFSIVLAGAAFGGTYLYSNPELQGRLGIKQYIDKLPWKREELLARARANPLTFDNLTLMLSTRDGTPLGAPQSSFTDAELASARYLKWTANFHNELAGLDARTQRVEARFAGPKGNQIASSAASMFIGPAQKTADFTGVALISESPDVAPGPYRIALYLNDSKLGEQRFDVRQDVAGRARAEAADAASRAAAKAEEERRREDARKLAMIEERRRNPLELRKIEFLNSTKTGTVLAGPADVFDMSKVLFVGWQVTFGNKLYTLEPSQYRVDAAYIAPDGHALGSVNDFQTVSASQKAATFSGRVGNSRGGAFLPGTYTVNFYLNGQFLAEKKFRVLPDTTSPYAASPSGAGPSSGVSPMASLGFPTLATGRIFGLPGGTTRTLELRLRPETNGFLRGALIVDKPGFGFTQIEGFVRGDRMQFQAPFGKDTYYFEGRRVGDALNGTFESTPAGERGTWTAHAK
ncbi:MAG: protein kinase domain-containing protein [Candidatus Binataceae bacterium]